MSIQVSEFRHISGKNDTEYIKLLKKDLERQKQITSKAIAKIKELSNYSEYPNSWIPCSKRLPDIKENHVSEPCIVYCENGAYGFTELEENIFGQVGWYCEREDEFHESLGKVLAWMPLPEPYNEGNDEIN